MTATITRSGNANRDYKVAYQIHDPTCFPADSAPVTISFPPDRASYSFSIQTCPLEGQPAEPQVSVAISAPPNGETVQVDSAFAEILYERRRSSWPWLLLGGVLLALVVPALIAARWVRNWIWPPHIAAQGSLEPGETPPAAESEIPFDGPNIVLGWEAAPPEMSAPESLPIEEESKDA